MSSTLNVLVYIVTKKGVFVCACVRRASRDAVVSSEVEDLTSLLWNWEHSPPQQRREKTSARVASTDLVSAFECAHIDVDDMLGFMSTKPGDVHECGGTEIDPIRSLKVSTGAFFTLPSKLAPDFSFQEDVLR